MDAGRKWNDARASRILSNRGVGARLFTGVVTGRRVVSRWNVTWRRVADVFAGTSVAGWRNFAALFTHFAVFDQESRLFTHFPFLFTHVSFLLADISHLFSHISFIFADQPQVQPDVTQVQPYFSAV